MIANDNTHTVDESRVYRIFSNLSIVSVMISLCNLFHQRQLCYIYRQISRLYIFEILDIMWLANSFGSKAAIDE